MKARPTKLNAPSISRPQGGATLGEVRARPHGVRRGSVSGRPAAGGGWRAFLAGASRFAGGRRFGQWAGPRLGGPRPLAARRRSARLEPLVAQALASENRQVGNFAAPTRQLVSGRSAALVERDGGSHGGFSGDRETKTNTKTLGRRRRAAQ